METNDDITLSEAKKITAELKGAILKLDTLNKDVLRNLNELKYLNDKMQNFTSILSKFNFKDEADMTENYAAYLAFLSNKLNEFSQNQNLKRLEKIIDKSDSLVNLSVVKIVIIVAVITTALNYVIIK
jgi:hypothetical protein